MKLDVNVLRYLSREDFRVLTAVEMGQKNVRGDILIIWSALCAGRRSGRQCHGCRAAGSCMVLDHHHASRLS